MPRFWANSDGEQASAALMMLEVGMCFGMVHCIAWLFSFPTNVELLMWRISSVAMTAVPIYILFVMIWGAQLGNRNLHKYVQTVFILGPLSGGILYIIARVITLVLAFTSLRELPTAAYETVHWTTFIPHV